MNHQISIASRFNGPPGSGNGGYSCGTLAAYLPGVTRVRLHAPPPLDKPMQVSETDGEVQLHDGETLVGSAVSVQLDMVIPDAPSLAEAEQASKGFLCFEDHSYPTCFVCGPGREGNDGLCLYPGPVKDWNLLACVWRPGADLLDDTGMVRPEFVWSALDCPGFFAAVGEDLLPTLLGELIADLKHPVPGSEPLVVFSWPMGREGRKLRGGVAIANQDGHVLACSQTTWIALRQEPA
ncbi:MAG: hypothetical protein V7746_05960 [Halioglobus sp.]